jgi:hypothetical protein
MVTGVPGGPSSGIKRHIDEVLWSLQTMPATSRGIPGNPSDQGSRTKSPRFSWRNWCLQKSGLPGHFRLRLLLLLFRRPTGNAESERMPEEGTNASAEPHHGAPGHCQAGHDGLARGYPRIRGNRQVRVVLALRPVDHRG